MQSSCPVCGSSERDDILSLPQLPVLVNAQVRPDEAPDVARGDMDLVVCLGCGHLYNRSFDNDLMDYDAAYENTLHFSKQFQTFARGLAGRLVDEHGLAGATVAELGSGPGHFLSMLCEAGVAEGIGYDPSYDPNRLGAPDHPAVTISTAMFPADGSLPAKLAFSQHVLEHLHDPVSALAAQREAVAAQEGAVYSEVPNGELMLEQCALWDLVYEHLSYFVPTSLRLACTLAGLEPTAVGADFGGQFLWCEAVPADGGRDGEADTEAVAAAVAAARAFGVAATERVASARRDLAAFADEGPVALWGAGSKGMTYLNLVADVAPVAGVVDINPRKAGWGVPGTDLVISGPEAMADVRPRTVLVANPVYVDEISAELSGLGVSADVRPLWG
ncbi:MAG: methyltransferase domain-containing protein [Ilumatobacter sp.]|uniref:class I SAM-dependent methyltransferase n=1 Tax=Ilumatobacter sp. TaxID=1967498 RepID=UPI00261F367A|nr:class I SAM-dependent methyltransferase [Ilumatobacter sp.]MDJ0768704.1 methyltransferase domain-containing protein [Ilumatobacter sp.]